jgi:DNA-directed RNA polymerase subunit N (RpoN/RPB10)
MIDAASDNDCATVDRLFDTSFSDAADKPPPARSIRHQLRLQRGVQHLLRLGPRAAAEFVAEIGNDFCCRRAILDHLDEWDRLTPESVAVAGWDRFPPTLDGG